MSEDFTNYENYKNAQIIFLDICLKSYNGIEIATKLKKRIQIYLLFLFQILMI